MAVDFKLIGKRIQEKRKELKKTQEDLAEYLDVSVGYVSNMERGTTKISLTTLVNILINSLSNQEKHILLSLLQTYKKIS